MIAVGLFTALLAFGGSKFLMTPTYQSVTKIYVLNKQDNSNTNVTYSDLQAGTQLVKDYSMSSISVLSRMCAAFL